MGQLDSRLGEVPLSAVDKDDPEAVAALAVEQIVGSLQSLAETQLAMCDILKDLLRELKRHRVKSGAP